MYSSGYENNCQDFYLKKMNGKVKIFNLKMVSFVYSNLKS